MRAPPPCTCNQCVSECKRIPGWMTPSEALAAMVSGLGARLRQDWEYRDGERVDIIIPAVVGYEGTLAPERAVTGPCTFHINDRCAIHDSGFKPLQCRMGNLCRRGEHPDEYVPKHEIVKLWDSEEGRMVVACWMAEVRP